MTIDKKIAARKAAAKYSTDPNSATAAKYSTDPNSATVEYAKLSGQPFLSNTDYTGLRDEMLSMLPPYRHPVNGELVEYMIFFDPDCVSITGLGYEQPAFVEALEKEGVADDVLTAVKMYICDSERCMIEHAQCRNDFGELKSIMSEAQRVYDENRDKRPERRNALVVQVLGLSTGFSPKRIDKKKTYVDYVKLIRKDGLSRKEAVEVIRKKHGLNSNDSTKKALFQYLKSHCEKLAQQHPSMFPDIEKRLKGHIPSRR
jgi:hypothetical protein